MSRPPLRMTYDVMGQPSFQTSSTAGIQGATVSYPQQLWQPVTISWMLQPVLQPYSYFAPFPVSSQPMYPVPMWSFQTVPSPSVTADKLLTHFLHIPQQNQYARLYKRSPPASIEDNVIVIDGSGSVGSCEFGKAKLALKYLMELTDPAKFNRTYAAVTFASWATVNFKFLPYSSAASEITKISYPGGGTNTQAGLAEAKNLFDNPKSGRRASSKKIVLVVTDGQSNQQKHLTVPNADALRSANVEVQVLAVGKYINGIDEMVKVASTIPGLTNTPNNKLLFRVKDYNGVWDVVKIMLEKVAPNTWRIVKGHYVPLCP
ncbi:hypothetical protein ACROYT_G006620 [Oculina patagonica]